MFADGSQWNDEREEVQECEACGDIPATVHVTRIEDGSVKQRFLCRTCAEEFTEELEGAAVVLLTVPSEFVELFATLAGGEESEMEADDFRECPVCGTTGNEVRETGLVGCSECYETFSELISEAVGDEEDGEPYVGKIPTQNAETAELDREIMRLERMLEELVETERFEEAAGVRDRLTELAGRRERSA